jgi:hypothetical protein
VRAATQSLHHLPHLRIVGVDCEKKLHSASDTS